jgi:hypothetical protein
VQDSDLSADAEVLQQHRAEVDREAAALQETEAAGVFLSGDMSQWSWLVAASMWHCRCNLQCNVEGPAGSRTACDLC